MVILVHVICSGNWELWNGNLEICCLILIPSHGILVTCNSNLAICNSNWNGNLGICHLILVTCSGNLVTCNSNLITCHGISVSYNSNWAICSDNLVRFAKAI